MAIATAPTDTITTEADVLIARAAGLRAEAEQRQAHTDRLLHDLEVFEGATFFPLRAAPLSRAGKVCEWFTMPRRTARSLRTGTTKTQRLLDEAAELERRARRIARAEG